MGYFKTIHNLSACFPFHPVGDVVEEDDDDDDEDHGLPVVRNDSHLNTLNHCDHFIVAEMMLYILE